MWMLLDCRRWVSSFLEVPIPLVLNCRMLSVSGLV